MSRISSAKTVMRIQQFHLRGFTLMELLVVIAIGALLLTLTPLAYQRISESADYRNTVRSMRAEMRAMREAAIQTQQPARLSVDVKDKRFGGSKWHVIPESIEVRTTVADTEMVDGIASIMFLPQGGATGGSVEIVRSNGTGARLRVDWLTGQISQEALLP